MCFVKSILASKVFCFMACFIIVIATNTQASIPNDSLDSINSNIQSIKDSTQKVKAFISFAEDFSASSEQYLTLMKSAVEIACQTNDNQSIIAINQLFKENIKVLTDLLAGFQKRGFYTEMIGLVNLVEKHTGQELTEQTKAQLSMYRAEAFLRIREYEKALEQYHISIEKFTALKDSFSLARANFQVGAILMFNKIYEEAYERMKIASDYFLVLGDTLSYARSLSGLGIVCKNLNRYDKAEEYYKKGIELSQKLGNYLSLSKHLTNLGILYKRQARYQEGIKVLEQALEIKRTNGNPKEIATTLNTLGQLYMYIDQYSKAERCANEALELASSANAEEEIYYAKELLTASAIGLNPRQDAIQRFYKYVVMRDSLSEAESAGLIAKMEVQFETEKKDAEIAQLSLENKIKEREAQIARWVSYVLVLFILLIATIIIFWFRIYKKQKEAEKLQAQIASREQLRGKIAAELHDKVCSDLIGAKMKLKAISEPIENTSELEDLQNFLSSIYEDTRNISNELKTPDWHKFEIREFIDKIIESTGLELSNEVEINIAENLEWDNLSLKKKTALERVLREASANTIKHAGSTHVSIQVLQKNKELILEYYDNGIGFNDKTKGNGIRNMEKRIKEYGGDIVFSSKNSKGTLIIINLPIN